MWGVIMRVGIILGYRLNDDGSRTARLDKRCDLAIKYHQEHGLDRLIVSGGVANPYTHISEAQAMEDYLVSHGFDKNLIIKEEQAMTTWDNMYYGMKIARDLGVDEVVVITTLDHYLLYYNTVKICSEAINDSNINMILYVDTIYTE